MMNDQKQKTYKLFFLVAALTVSFSVVVWLAYIVVGPVIPRSKLALIQEGMSQQSVEDILGKPTDVLSKHEWHYSRPGNSGWVAIGFDDRERVTSVNDESP